MTLIRLMLDLAIPETVYNSIPATDKQKFKDAVVGMKAKAVTVNQELTVKATRHRCHHDTGGSCEPEQDI